MIIVLVGKSASGKDVIEEALANRIYHVRINDKLYRYKRLVSHTSRPKRPNEQEGVNYYFVSKNHIDDLIDTNQTVEHTKYVVDGETWKYALSKKEISDIKDNEIGVVTVNPHGVKQLLDNFDAETKSQMIVIYVDADDEVREFRYFNREQGSNEVLRGRWEQRVKADTEDFAYLENKLIPRMYNIKSFVKFDNSINYKQTHILNEVGKKVNTIVKEILE